MPVQKFRSVAEVPDTPWGTPGDPRLYASLRGLWTAMRSIHPRTFPAGVYKHRTMDEMNHQRDEWTAEFVSMVSATNRRG